MMNVVNDGEEFSNTEYEELEEYRNSSEGLTERN